MDLHHSFLPFDPQFYERLYAPRIWRVLKNLGITIWFSTKIQLWRFNIQSHYASMNSPLKKINNQSHYTFMNSLWILIKILHSQPHFFINQSWEEHSIHGHNIPIVSFFNIKATSVITMAAYKFNHSFYF